MITSKSTSKMVLTINTLSLKQKMYQLIDLYLSGKRRIFVMRFIIYLNAVYTVLLGVTLFVQVLKLIHSADRYISYPTIGRSHQMSRLSLQVICLSIAIIGHISGIFAIIRKDYRLMLFNAVIGFNAFLMYSILIFYYIYSIPVIVFIFLSQLTQIQLSLTFNTIIVSLHLIHKKRIQNQNIV